MNKKFNIFIYSLICLLGFSFTACDDDDDVNVAKAVLASVSNLQYEVQGNDPQIITVYSDAQWTVETPEWITVSPSTGGATSTETTVTITVNDNIRENLPDLPRKYELVFKGNTVASEAHVMVRQDGNRYRDVVPVTIAEMNSQEDESTVILNNVTVSSLLEGKFFATDGLNQVLVKSDEEVKVGDVVNVYSYMSFDTQKMPVIVAENVEKGKGTAAALPEAIDLTEQIDDVKAELAPRAMVKITGKLDGKDIVVDGAKLNHGVVLDAAADVNIADLGGHSVTVTGYYAGTATPAVNLYVQSVEDHGSLETIYFFEDWEWLDEWSVSSGVGQTVETDDLGAKATALTSVKYTVDGVQMTCFDYIEKQGYEFVYDKGDNKRTYLQRNYLKFGKTGNHSGITLKPITTVPEGAATILSFDWCPMRQGSGTLDPVTLYVKVVNGDNEQVFDVPTHGWESGHTLEWIRATIDLDGVAIKGDTKITISQNEWEVGTANRWFLDNIKLIAK